MKALKMLGRSAMAIAMACTAMGMTAADKIAWGDFKIFLDPGHSLHENQGLYSYSEAQKVFAVANSIRDYLKEYTDIPDSCIKMSREDETTNVELEERTDMANAWGADFYYSIHSDSGSDTNATLFLFGGWNNNGVSIEKTPTGGKAFGDILDPNLTSVMYKTISRGNWYDRCYYYQGETTHDKQYPYLWVNRCSNMASLLSEGGFHTHPVQQPLNMNASYKHLEAFGAYRSILKYRGLQCPTQPMLAGVVTNSENGVPIDAVTVTVDGKTVVTDSYASLFSQYTKNKDLIHNGFYLFEGLEAGKTYTISYSADGYAATTQDVTMKSDPQGLSGDNVTWGNVTMTATAPATVASISVTDTTGVRTTDDIVLTFSRYMDKTSVESAFSIDNSGKVTLSWDNDYTLRVNIHQLASNQKYTMKISGSVAKNSQTSQFLDGDGNGTAGGDYTFSFTTLPPDLEAPYIVSTTPQADSTILYTLRPVIRVEFNEKLDWNEDNAEGWITVVDKDGTKYEGVTKHEVIAGNSVVHYFFSKDLPLDRCFQVTIRGGLKDLSGNVSKDSTFKFLSEYHPITSEKVIDATADLSTWFPPHGSGSSKGWRSEETNTMVTSTSTSSVNQSSAFAVHYDFDPETMAEYWALRIYFKGGTYYSDSKDAVIEAYVCGDGSKNMIGHCLRDKSDGFVKHQKLQTMDFRGWKQLVCHPYTDPFVNVSGSKPQINGNWEYDAFYIQHYKDNDDDNPDMPQGEAWIGDFRFDQLRYTHYNNTAVQTAKLSDISSVKSVLSSGISIVKSSNALEISSPESIKNVTVYSISGNEMISVNPDATNAMISTESLASGVYIAKVVTSTKEKVQKFIVK
jgi:N-acetylmuramoyl-L-alanine amidase